MGVARWSLVVGSLLGATAVAAGAFGAHGLAATLEAAGQAENWQTACRYGMDHALALVATGLVARVGRPSAALTAAAACFLAGTLIFGGCLGALALSGWKLLGAVVPVGGGLLIAGWILLAAGSRQPRNCPSDRG